METTYDVKGKDIATAIAIVLGFVGLITGIAYLAGF